MIRSQISSGLIVWSAVTLHIATLRVRRNTDGDFPWSTTPGIPSTRRGPLLPEDSANVRRARANRGAVATLMLDHFADPNDRFQ